MQSLNREVGFDKNAGEPVELGDLLADPYGEPTFVRMVKVTKREQRRAATHSPMSAEEFHARRRESNRRYEEPRRRTHVRGRDGKWRERV